MSKKKKSNITSFAKKAGGMFLSAALIATTFTGLGVAFPRETERADAATFDYGLADTSQEGVILHCWNWSYNNIKKYMKDIAAAGFTSIQTSPVTQPKDYYWEGVAYGNVGIPDGTGDADHGNWWKVYQPVTMSICDNGHTWFGTKAEFKAMCDEAEKYGVRVIVDIVANHMGNIKGWAIGDEETVMGDISPQIGEFWNPDMLTDSSYWHISTSWTHSSDGRFDVTQGNMGQPDLNTGDPRVQQMVLNLMKECIDCGADGFRFDAAKHIETPADNPDFASDFWDVVLGGAREYYKKVNGYDGVYFYGEVLNRIDDKNAEAYYRSVMSITDNSTSDNMRNSTLNGQAGGLGISNYCGYIAGQGKRAVLWAESHDTYMGGGSSYDANDKTINQTWAIVATRKDSTALYFARPYYSKDILANDTNKARQDDATILKNVDYTQMGDVGSLTWASPSVVAVNRFRNFFIGQSEKIGSSGNIAYNVRGNSGVVLSKLDGPGSVSIRVGMKDGTYTDQVTGEKFTVSGGVLKGKVTGADCVAVIYNPTVDYGSVNPVEPTVLKISASTADDKTTFTTDTVDVTMKVENAVSATYETTEGKKGSFTGSKTITVGSTLAGGESVSVTITATAQDGTVKTKTYTFTKKGVRTGYPTLKSGGVVFDNEGYDWTKVYAYVYSEELGINNAAWPGVQMTEVNGNYFTYEIPSSLTGTVYVIFNNGSGIQYPTGQGLEMLSTEKKLFVENKLIDLPESQPQLSVSLKASAQSCNLGDSITFTASATNASGSVKYTFSLADGTIVQSDSSNVCKWTPTSAGTYTMKVVAKDSKTSVSATCPVTVIKQQTEKLTADCSISAASINLGTALTIKGGAKGGTTPYQYKYEYRKTTSSYYTTIKPYSTSTYVSFTPSSAGSYKIKISVKDSTGKVVEKYFDITVKSSVALAAKCSISATTINLGTTLTINAGATGGKAPYQYKIEYRKSTSSNYTVLKAYGTRTSATYTPTSTGAYKFKISIKDSTGKIVEKYYDVTVKGSSALTAKCSISATTINLGTILTINAGATGGKAPYQYKYEYRKSTASSYRLLNNYSTISSMTFVPESKGNYKVKISIKDSTGSVVEKYYDVTVR